MRQTCILFSYKLTGILYHKKALYPVGIEDEAGCYLCKLCIYLQTSSTTGAYLTWDGETKGTLRTEIGCNNCGPHLEFCELDTEFDTCVSSNRNRKRQIWMTLNICCFKYWERQTKGLSDYLNLEVGSYDWKLGFIHLPTIFVAFRLTS